jgi:PLAT/LH2 domain
MKTKSNVSATHNIKSRFVCWSIVMFVMMIPASASAVFATPAETAKIWRVQMRIQTADVDDAGTDDDVSIGLNSGNKTWLDYGRDDFPRNNTFTYDLNLENISHISDLDYIIIRKEGDDGLCLKSFTLLINGRVIYTHVFSGSGHWLDTESGYSPYFTVTGSAMRQDDSWRAYTQPAPPTVIPRAETVSRIEGMVGHFIKGNNLSWGPKFGTAYVEVYRKVNTSTTLHVDLDLHYQVPVYFDPEVDVDFDIRVSCKEVDGQKRIVFDVVNVNVAVDSDWYSEVLSLGLVDFIGNKLAKGQTDAVSSIHLDGAGVPFCPGIIVDDDGDINFILSSSLAVNQSLATQVESGQTLATQVESGQTIEANSVWKGKGSVPLAVSCQGARCPFRRNETIEDGDTPLAVSVETADEIKAGEETAYALLVTSNRGEAASVNVQVELPAMISLADSMMEVVDANGARSMAPQVSYGEGGEIRLSFNDRLDAGAENRYRLSLRFPYAPKADLQINAAAVEEGGGAPIKSTTFFQLENGAVKARGTFKTSNAVKAAPITGKAVTLQTAKGVIDSIGR